ncbi:MAG TPA: hypothetical protein VFA12_17230, partial [Stellaceae bacterium]|nr:hypothetical protein [Stellaceae bacterium]
LSWPGLTHGCPVKEKGAAPEPSGGFSDLRRPLGRACPGHPRCFRLAKKAEKEGVDARHKAGQGASSVVSYRSRTTGFAEPDSRGLDPAI